MGKCYYKRKPKLNKLYLYKIFSSVQNNSFSNSNKGNYLFIHTKLFLIILDSFISSYDLVRAIPGLLNLNFFCQGMGDGDRSIGLSDTRTARSWARGDCDQCQPDWISTGYGRLRW